MNFKNFNILFLIVSFIFIGTFNSYADLNGENWQHVCGKEDKNNCLIGVRNYFENQETGKKQKLATAYILIGTSSKKKLNILEKEQQTYKLGESKTIVPILFVDLPLNVDLRQNPLVRADGKNVGLIPVVEIFGKDEKARQRCVDELEPIDEAEFIHVRRLAYKPITHFCIANI